MTAPLAFNAWAQPSRRCTLPSSLLGILTKLTPRTKQQGLGTLGVGWWVSAQLHMGFSEEVPAGSCRVKVKRTCRNFAIVSWRGQRVGVFDCCCHLLLFPYCIAHVSNLPVSFYSVSSSSPFRRRCLLSESDKFKTLSDARALTISLRQLPPITYARTLTPRDGTLLSSSPH